MPSPIPIIAALVMLGLLIVLVPVINRLRAHRLSSFQATVLDKRKKTTMTYAGVFIPLVIYYLRVENGIELNVSYTAYRSVDVGDTVLVSRFSDGSYRLDH
jgi:hypothetical protein